MGLILAQSKIWENVYNSFVTIFTSIGRALSENAVVAILTFALLLIAIIYRIIRNRRTTEIMIFKAVSKINNYLSKNPFITEENLVEFNRLMMSCPKNIRFQWQRYIINRDKKPSDFINEENCISRPLRTNSYKQGLKNFLITAIVICVISAAFIIGFRYNSSGMDSTQLGNMLNGLIVPSLALLVSFAYMLFGGVLHNAIMNDLYYSFTNFEKSIDRAVLNMPEAIDYEIIFTPKEIQNGIPALQEFLEQRALYEQEQIKKAQESEVVHENYDFSGLDVDGRLVMERAMRESELYLGNKQRIEQDISMIRVEQDVLKRDFDEKSKDSQRSLRDIREEIKNLKNKIEMATNEITRSSIRRQQQAEVEKEQSLMAQMEKDAKEFEEKFAKHQVNIDEKLNEIKEGKIKAEKALTDEFTHFSEKIREELKVKAEDESKETVDALVQEKNELSLILEEKEKLMADKLALYEDKAENYDKLELEIGESKHNIEELANKVSELNKEIEDKNQEIFEVRQELESRKREIIKKDEMIDSFKKKKAVEIFRYFDANGNEFYFDENENPYYLDENGNAVYYDNNIGEEEFVEAEPAEIVEENLEEQEPSWEPYTDDSIYEDKNVESNLEAEPVEEAIEEAVEEPTEEVKEDKPKAKKARKKSTKKEQKPKPEENEELSIEETLNKLAKAAEEKMKENAKVKNSASAKKAGASAKAGAKKSTAKKTNSSSKQTNTSKKANAGEAKKGASSGSKKNANSKTTSAKASSKKKK